MALIAQMAPIAQMAHTQIATKHPAKQGKYATEYFPLLNLVCFFVVLLSVTAGDMPLNKDLLFRINISQRNTILQKKWGTYGEMLSTFGRSSHYQAPRMNEPHWKEDVTKEETFLCMFFVVLLTPTRAPPHQNFKMLGFQRKSVPKLYLVRRIRK